MHRLRCVCALLMITGCGYLEKAKPDQSATDASSNQEVTPEPTIGSCVGGVVYRGVTDSDIRFKGTGLLAHSLEETLGAGRTQSVTNDKENLLDTYESNFGSTKGLSYGETYADTQTATTLMTGYLLALNNIAYNAAVRCDADGRKDLCQCGDRASAQAMLQRAVPYQTFCTGGDGESIVDRFLAVCQQDYTGAISALIASTAFAKRN